MEKKKENQDEIIFGNYDLRTKQIDDYFDCCAYPGISIRVSEEDCKTCDMGPKGCPAYNPEWLKKEKKESIFVMDYLGHAQEILTE